MTDPVPPIVRAAASFWLRTATWGVEVVSTELRSYAREFLGISDLDDRVGQLGPGPPERPKTTAVVLRSQGAELLRDAADVDHEDGAHPAYARIIQELAPDEARILRLLALEGPQPSVDVRAANLIGVGSQLIAPGLNMIGPQAGLRHRARIPAYLNNLYRLGLIWFSDEPLEDPLAYQVLEAQPEVLGAIKQTTRAKTVKRSICLSPFGADFCDVCLPLDQDMNRNGGAHARPRGAAHVPPRPAVHAPPEARAHAPGPNGN